MMITELIILRKRKKSRIGQGDDVYNRELWELGEVGVEVEVTSSPVSHHD